MRVHNFYRDLLVIDLSGNKLRCWSSAACFNFGKGLVKQSFVRINEVFELFFILRLNIELTLLAFFYLFVLIGFKSILNEVGYNFFDLFVGPVIDVCSISCVNYRNKF